MPWPTFETPPSAAFVDVDGTLLAETTTYLCARILLRRGFLKRSMLLRGLYHGLQHRFGRLDYGRLVAIGLNSIAKIPIDEMEQVAQENFDQYVKPRLFEGVVEHFQNLSQRGTPVVLVTSSPRIVIEPLGTYLGCADLITTPLRIEEGRVVGIGDGPLCYGEGKRYWAEQWADQQGISMDEAVAYADNWSDRALLERVGRAVVVHPQRRLRRLASQKGWTIVWPRRPRLEESTAQNN